MTFHHKSIPCNHVGSCLLTIQIYFLPPAPEEFYAAVAFPPLFDKFATAYATLNYENNGSLSTKEGSFSSVQSIVCFDNATASLSAVHISILGKQIMTVAVGILTRITKDEFLKGFKGKNNEFNVSEELHVQSFMTSDVPAGYEYSFSTEAGWCGGLINDKAYTESPYQEPNLKMKEDL
eukprot:11948271-Ditylum_brightwellii.AAC.2